ncbi:MAG: hypothetical protein QOJ98_179 [Acidobacteriota bacterium]|jgi:pimeloyl-ACP methyl ester carboxylesterase|nr:hypothetical protein [Acidobacteriota bacterium]
MNFIRVSIAALLVAGCASATDLTPVAAPRHLIYLHGRIVQEQESRRPKHPEHGYYELDEIAAAFRKRGFVVTAERRPKGTSVGDGADVVVKQVRELLRSGVPADRITVVGASMGAGIAFRVAARLQEPDLRFALLGPCLSVNAPAVAAEEGAYPSGRLLSVREESDVPSSDCPAWSGAGTDPARLRARELVLATGLRHGFLYRPLPEWVEPVAEWASKD